MSVPLPTLDTNGWVSDVQSKITGIFLDYLANNYSQSDIHLGNVRSLPYTIASNPRDMRGLRTAIERDLEILYGAYTDSVTTNISITDFDDGNELNYYNIVLDVRVQEGLSLFNIGRYIKVENGKIITISDS